MESADAEPNNPEKMYKKRGVGLIIHNRSSDRFLFFLRDDIPTIPFPGMIDIIGGHLDDGEEPEEALVREIAEELDDVDTGQPFVPNGYTQFKQYIDELGTQQTIFGLELEEEPHLKLNEGQRLVWLGRAEIGNTDFAFGFKVVVQEYVAKVSKPHGT